MKPVSVTNSSKGYSWRTAQAEARERGVVARGREARRPGDGQVVVRADEFVQTRNQIGSNEPSQPVTVTIRVTLDPLAAHAIRCALISLETRIAASLLLLSF